MSAYARWEDPQRGEGAIPDRAVSYQAFDTETHLGAPAQPGIAAPPIVVASIANSRGCFLVERERALAWLRSRLTNGDHVVGTNIAYDLACAAAADPTLVDVIFAALDAGFVHDIAIREALADIARGELVERGEDGIGIRYGMRLLAERYLGIDISEDKKGAQSWRKRYAELEGTPIERWPWKARVYPLRDVAFPLEIFHKQTGNQNLHREADEVRAAFALQLMSVHGVRTDGQAVCGLAFDAGRVDASSTTVFQQAGILRANGTEDRKRLAELVTIAYGGFPPRTAPTLKFPNGQVSSDRDTLVECGDPLLEHYGRAGKNDKLLTTYLPILERGIYQPWNPQFNVLVATTRVSSDAQQFPQFGGVRECIVARPGYVFCSVDYGGLELRTMSQRAIWSVGFSKMAEFLNTGRDPHLGAAAAFLGMPYEETVKQYKAGDLLMKLFRDLGKIWNFGKGGGMGPGAMTYNARKGQKGETTTAPDGTVYAGARFCLLAKQAEHCGVERVVVKVQGKERRVCSKCLDVAKQLDAGWLRAWPEQAALFQMANKLSKGARYIQATIPRVDVVRGKCGYTQWLNTPFQGLGAAATKRAMWLVAREMYTDRESPLFGSRLALNVHDELIAEMLLWRATFGGAGDRMAQIMRDTLTDYVPDLAKSVEADPALSYNMSKSAKTVRNAAGVLQVWQPEARA